MHSHHTDEGAASASTPDEALAHARSLLADELQTRMQACAAEIEQALAKHGMRLDITTPQISIVPQHD